MLIIQSTEYVSNDGVLEECVNFSSAHNEERGLGKFNTHITDWSQVGKTKTTHQA